MSQDLLLKTCQEADADCARDIVRIYASEDQEPELSIGAHIDRLLALEAALEDEDQASRDIAEALHVVRNNLHELTGIVLGGAS
tara:strand:+ start:1106 stop:1357 length:252 start_codon:yes stop_codon:yes gene_type:complete